jgi:hypothetical protein
MPSDDEDTPKGALIALALITCIVLFIVMSTFESCTDMEGDRIRDYCSEVRFQMDSYLGENNICISSNGTLMFSIINIGELDIEGVTFRYAGNQINVSKPIYTISSAEFKVGVGIENYELMSPIEVIPLVYFPENNETVSCNIVRQFIKDVDLCIRE